MELLCAEDGLGLENILNLMSCVEFVDGLESILGLTSVEFEDGLESILDLMLSVEFEDSILDLMLSVEFEDNLESILGLMLSVEFYEKIVFSLQPVRNWPEH